VLIDLEELEAAQAAEQLGIEASSLRAYLSLARAKLRERLRAHAPEGGSR
jgi:DNA-directed RNA polymerase specialized sigma24 family protein